MRKAGLLLFVLLIRLEASSVAAELAESASAALTELACDGNVLRQSWELLALGGYGSFQTERAAFVIRDGDGGLSFRMWPYVAAQRRATFHGVIPRDAIAIVHTHPNRHPFPSPDDAWLASRLGMPVYVVTRTAIARTTGRKTETIWSGDWSPLPRAGPGSRGGAVSRVCGQSGVLSIVAKGAR